MVSVLVPVVRFPEPADADERVNDNSEAAQVLAIWRDLVGTEPSLDADAEDFWEGAYRLAAAVTCGADRVWIYADQRSGVARLHGSATATALVDDLLADPDLIVYGSVARFNGSRDLTLRYHVDNIDWVASAALAPYLDRHITPCGFMSDHSDPRDIVAIAGQYAARGADRIFVKTTKKGSHAVLPITTDFEANRNALFGAFDWEPVHLEDQPGAFLACEVVPMRFEYRMYLVNGLPVTGAGNVVAHTPLDAVPGQSFHTLLEEHRYTSALTAEPELVERYVEFATRVGADLLTEGLLPPVLNVDVALGPANEPLVVEIHSGLINTGLFATDPALFLRSVVTSNGPRSASSA